MDTPVLNDETRKTLDSIGAWFAPVIRERRKQKILRMASLLMLEKGITSADSDTIIEAGKFVLPTGFSPRFAAMKGVDREAAKKPYLNLEEYYKAPRQVKRWDIKADKPAKPAAEMKVLGIAASLRPGSNSTALVTEALRGAAGEGATTAIINLAQANIEQCSNILIQRDYFVAKDLLPELDIAYCPDSEGCESNDNRGVCLIDDDMPGIYEQMQAADTIIIGFPIYNGWEPAALAGFMERWARYESCLGKALTPNRRGMVLCACGYNDPDTYEHILDNLISKLNMRKVDVVEALNCCGTAGILSGLDEQGEAIIRHTPDEFAKAFAAGKTLVTGIK
jgi:multimeric flavodoxin WrbA